MPRSSNDAHEISSLLHDQWRSTKALRDALLQILNYLGTDPFVGIDLYDDVSVSTILSEVGDRLEKTLSKAVDHVGSDLEARRIPAAPWNKICCILEDIRNTKITEGAVTPVWLRLKARDVTNQIEILRNSPAKPGLNKEHMAELLSAAKESERLACLLDLHRAIDMTELTNESVLSFIRAIREPETEETPVVCGIGRTVRETVMRYEDQARIRGIKEIRVKNRSRGAKIKIVKSDFIQALGNLLDNAIKYTGELPPNSAHDHTWIEVRVDANTSSAFVEIESWGIPITEEEKRGDFLPTLGYRGWFARQTDVEGSGTGLADVKSFAERNGGFFSFDSQAVNKSSKIVNTTTTVSLGLPRIG